MTDKEFAELESRIEQRNKLKQMKADMDAEKKERFSHSRSECMKSTYAGEKPFASTCGGRAKQHTAGGSFMSIQIQGGEA